MVTERRDAAADTELAGRLAPLRHLLQRQVATGGTTGLVTLVDDGSGHPVVDRYGARDTATALMGRATAVPIGAVTTVFTTTTVLLLVEDGAIDLHDTIDDLLPELADRPVLRTVGSPLHDTVAPQRPVTLVDLLSSRSGFGVGPAAAPSTPVRRSARSLGLGVFDTADASAAPLGIDEWLQRLGTLPLLHQPGERWSGRADAMVLGAVVERLTGKPLPAVMSDRLLSPLHLHHTRFAPGPARPAGGDGGGDNGGDGARQVRRFVDAAAGLISTADDLWRFAWMLLDDGRTGDGGRLLAPSTVRSMLRSRGPTDVDGDEHRGGGLGVSTPSTGLRSVRSSDGFGLDDVGVSWRSNSHSDATVLMLARPGADAGTDARLRSAFWQGVDRAVI